MRKGVLLGVVALLAVGVLAPPASAQLVQGDQLGKLRDWGSFFYDDEGDATTAAAEPVI
jgi:uncharacterized membrane protein (DUF441 family)